MTCLHRREKDVAQPLVIRGEAGIGKTALIDYAVSAADDFLVVRFTGAEPERGPRIRGAPPTADTHSSSDRAPTVSTA